MRKIVNLSALIFFIWLVLDTFNIPSHFLNFLLVGQLPGTTTELSPLQMLAIVTAITACLVFEFAARRLEFIRRLRKSFMKLINQRERLPLRRYNRI